MTDSYLAPYPAHNIRQKIESQDWEACIQSWIIFTQKQLLSSDKEFSSTLQASDNVPNFLISYCKETARDVTQSISPGNPILHTLVFRLGLRTLQVTPKAPTTLLTFTFLSDFCIIYKTNAVLRSQLLDIWRAYDLDVSAHFTQNKKKFLSTTRSKPSATTDPELADTLRRMSILTHTCPLYGRFLLAGSESLDSLSSLFHHASACSALQRSVLELTYLAMRSLVLEPQPNASALLDQLYDLKAAAERQASGEQAQFLRCLVSGSALLRMLRQRLPAGTLTRAQPLIAYLGTLDDGRMAQRARVRKGKKRAPGQGSGYGKGREVHMHDLRGITQVQELFPDLGAGFVAKMLEYYQDNVEQARASLLEPPLPPHLMDADRTEPLQASAARPISDAPIHLEPRITPPLIPQRKNIYDNDDFDKLALSARNLHIGKKERGAAVQAVDDKARIYSALVLFDSDDDERDDTYDVEDVGGTVDVQGYDKDAEYAVSEQNTEALYRAWKLSPGTFQRDAAARKSPARASLRSETNMTDEAIEGFAYMLHREPRRLRALEARFPDFTGEQQQLHSARWDQNHEGAESGGGEEGRGASRGRGRGRGQGPRGRGGRGGGNVAGPADNKQTQVARQRKDENKAQRANHNRRAQRARKVARAGFPG